jgi:Protein of unknown function (DUF2934)
VKQSRCQKANNYMATKRVSENKVVVPSAPAAPVRRKSAAPKRVSRPAVEVATVAVAEPEVLPVVAAESFQDAVARLAYSYWEARGCEGGSPEADWLRAEQELAVK